MTDAGVACPLHPISVRHSPTWPATPVLSRSLQFFYGSFMLTRSVDSVATAGPDERSAPQQSPAWVDPPVKLGSLLPLFEGDPAFQKRLIETFLTHSQSTLAAMRQALGTADAVMLRQAAHSLKGAAGEIFAEPLRKAAAALEAAARQGRTDATTASLVQAVAIEFARVAEVLRAAFP